MSSKIQHSCILLIVFTFCTFLPRPTGSLELPSIDGYFKSYFLALNQPDVTDLSSTQNKPFIGAVDNRLRLNLSGKINRWSSYVFTYDFSPRVQDKSLFEKQLLQLGFAPETYRAIDLKSRVYPNENDSVSSFAIFQNLDRAFVTITTRWADVFLGRQAIAWGSTRMINPTDVLVPYAFNQLDVEDRMGVDAVRVRVPVGFMGEVDVGYVFGDDFEFANSAMFARYKFNFRHTDISLLAVGFRENLLAGFDLTRSISGAGFWLEAAHVFSDALNNERAGDDEDYFRISVGLDYSLRDGTYLFVEYHFNQPGAQEPDDYLTRSERTAYREGSVYLLGKHYLAPGISRQISPLITLSCQALFNITDPSIFFMPQVEYNIAEDIYLSAGAYLGLGDNPEYLFQENCDPCLRLQSEFGAYPDFYFTSFRVYF